MDGSDRRVDATRHSSGTVVAQEVQKVSILGLDLGQALPSGSSIHRQRAQAKMLQLLPSSSAINAGVFTYLRLSTCTGVLGCLRFIDVEGFISFRTFAGSFYGKALGSMGD